MNTLVELEVNVDGQTYTYQRVIEAEPAEGVLGEPRFDVMQNYAPVLRFHEDELYHPTRYEALFENSELRGVVDEDEEVLLDNANLYDVSVIDHESKVGYEEDYFEFILPRALTGEWGGWSSGYGVSEPPERDSLAHLDPSESDVYPPTVYSNLVEDVDFEPDDSYVDRFPDTDSSEMQEDTYTAIGYWMVYVHDPKPLISVEEGLVSADRIAAHTGDQEPFYILFDQDTGEPEWVLAQQHMGGEYRKWEHVEREDARPVIYPAEGAHSNFFGVNQSDNRQVRAPSDGDLEPRYIYQDQYLDDPGNTDRSFLSDEGLNYLDPVAYEDTGTTWAHQDADIQRSTDEAYEISVLTGDEAWSDYDGNVYTYPQPFEELVPLIPSDTGATEGTIPQQVGPKFDDPGEWAEDGDGRRLFPDIAQVDGEFSDEENEFWGIREDVGDRIQQSVVRPEDGDEPGFFDVCEAAGDVNCVEAPPAVVAPNQMPHDDELIGWTEADDLIGVNVVNPGMQPHDFTLDLATDAGHQADYSFYVNSIYPRNVAGAEVPLSTVGITESDVAEEGSEAIRDFDFDATLSLYPETYETDSKDLSLRVTDGLPEPSLDITTEAQVNAGTVEDPRSVSVDLVVSGLSSDEVRDGDWSVEVEGEEVSAWAEYDGLERDSDLRGEATLRFTAPDKDEARSYDVTVTLETEDQTLSASEDDLLAYMEPGEAGATATAIVVDVSGSMSARDVGGGTRMSAAKDAAHGYLERKSDSDYVAIVEFSSGSTVLQGLTRLDEGRDDAEAAIDSMNAGGLTNMGAGLFDGIDEVEKAPDGVHQNVVLMSDGGRNRGPSESSMRDAIRERMNPEGICLQTNTLGDGADFEFKRSLADASDCSQVTESFTRDEIVQDFIELIQEFTASELVKLVTGQIGVDDVFGGSFEVDDEASNVILDVAVEELQTETSSLQVESTRQEDVAERHEIDVRDDRSDIDDEAEATEEGDVDVMDSGIETASVAAEDREVRIYRPNGSIADPGADSDVEVSVTDDRTVYRLTDPEAGSWSYEIDGRDEAVEFETRVTANSLVELDVATSSDRYYAGSEADVTAKLYGTEAVGDADVEARVEAPDGSKETVVFDEVEDGVYRATVGLDDNASGTYEATVTAHDEDGHVERQETVSWVAEHAAPVALTQPETPVVEQGGETEATLTIQPEALLGIRSVEVSVSELGHDSGNETLSSSYLSFDRSHLVESGETVEVPVTVSAPEDAAVGNYTAEAGGFVDDSGVTVDELEVRVVDDCPLPPDTPDTLGDPEGPEDCPPGHGGTPPGLDDIPPGHDGSDGPPGHDDGNPGQGAGPP